MIMADEKFSIVNVALKMDTIEEHFAAFADTLANINSFIETNVNASLASSVYGDLGAKLLNIWKTYLKRVDLKKVKKYIKEILIKLLI